MDLNTIEHVQQPGARGEIPPFSPGDAFVGGGTWLFSEPQPHLRRLVDLSTLGWEPLRVSPEGLEIAATCTLAELNAANLPAEWPAAHLLADCCRCLMGSFKVWNMATVGGNLCMSLPAGPMISLSAGLEATCLLWAPDGTDRRVSLFDFITGPRQNALRPGEILRSIHIPAAVLARSAEMRRASLTRHGRSAALLIGTRDRTSGAFTLAVTASVPRPLQFHFPEAPDAQTLRARLEAGIPPEGFYDDIHGAPAWRRHMTVRMAEEIRNALYEGDRA
ncbi:FAD binding domain-containing protein [Aquabacter cavernae]|uniref:FAD binding domain-containing protein n=1 Tax=Aquabacter cavernae TaxID=2496029 RepID=UPI000F8DE00E|nr:FAD binding domain-containing protein [Aquabacter cavernae]